MNSKFSIILLCCILTIISCKKDETSSTIAGTWELKDLEYSGEQSIFVDGIKDEDFSNTFTGSLVGQNTATTTFNDSPQTYSASGTYSVKLVTTFNDGTSFTNIVEIKEYADSGTWTLVDGKLSAKNSNGESSTSDVVFKDNNHMEVTSKIDQETNADIETKIHTKADVTLIYTRK